MNKKFLLIIILLNMCLLAGCASKKEDIPTDNKYHEDYDTQYNFKVTPVPVSIMKSNNGFYEILMNKLYYAENNEKVIMCNKPDCTHDLSTGCESLAMQYAQIEKFNDRICYLYENNGKNSLISIKKDGSDRKELVSFTDYDSIASYIIHRGKVIFIYQNNTDKIDDNGIIYECGVAVYDLQTKSVHTIIPNDNSKNTDGNYDGLTAYGDTVYFFKNNDSEDICTFYEYSLTEDILSKNSVSDNYPVYELKWITQDSMYLTYPDIDNMQKVLIQTDKDGQNVKEIARCDLFDDIYTNDNYILISSSTDSRITIYDMNFTKLSESDVIASNTDYISLVGFDNNIAYFKGDESVRILDLEHPESYNEV